MADLLSKEHFNDSADPYLQIRSILNEYESNLDPELILQIVDLINSQKLDLFLQYDEDLTLIEYLIYNNRDELLKAIFQTLDFEQKEQFYRCYNRDISPVIWTFLSHKELPLFRQALAADNFCNVEELQNAIDIVHALKDIYGILAIDKDSIRDLSKVIDIIKNLKITNYPKYHDIKKSFELIDYFLSEPHPASQEVEGVQIFIKEAGYNDHEAFFVLIKHLDGQITAQYCDAWNGIFGKNEDKYSFGVTEFFVNDDFSDLSDLEKYLNFQDCESPDDADKAEMLFSFFVRHESEKMVIAKKSIPTKIQARLNCTVKSLFILLRCVLEIVNPAMRFYPVEGKTLVDCKSLQDDDFLQFSEISLVGKGFELYKDFRRDLIDEMLERLMESSKIITRGVFSFVIIEALESALEVTARKMAKIEEVILDAEFPPANLEVQTRHYDCLHQRMERLTHYLDEYYATQDLSQAEESDVDEVVVLPQNCQPGIRAQTGLALALEAVLEMA